MSRDLMSYQNNPSFEEVNDQVERDKAALARMSEESMQVRQGKAFLQSMDPYQEIAKLKDRIQENIEKIIEKRFQKTIHYGPPFPDSKKDTLLLPGAETINSALMIQPADPVTIKEVLRDDPFYYHVERKITLIHIASGLPLISVSRSCNSNETKYRYRQMTENQLKVYPDLISQIDTYRKKIKRGQGGRDYTVFLVPNPEPWELINTILAMADKRAYVAATRMFYAISHRFDSAYDVPAVDITPDEPKRETRGRRGPKHMIELKDRYLELGRELGVTEDGWTEAAKKIKALFGASSIADIKPSSYAKVEQWIENDLQAFWIKNNYIKKEDNKNSDLFGGQK